MRPPVDYIARTKALYDTLGYGSYRWVENKSAPPWAPVRKPLSESKVGLAGSGGIYAEGQVAFHYKDDISYRIIAGDTPKADLRASHFAYDLTDARKDPDVVFPLDNLRALAAEGHIGAVSDKAYAFMGGIYSARAVRERLAPALADHFVEDQVDLVLLVPV